MRTLLASLLLCACGSAEPMHPDIQAQPETYTAHPNAESWPEAAVDEFKAGCMEDAGACECLAEHLVLVFPYVSCKKDLAVCSNKITQDWGKECGL